MARWLCGICLALICAGCSGTVADEDAESFCDLTVEILETYEAANDQLLTPTAAELVDANVAALRPLIPDGYVDDYRLRYWPSTDITGLNTSGIAAQEAFDRMAKLFDRTCDGS